jgi:hypothetical protein
VSVTRIKYFITLCLALAALVPAGASATTVRLGPSLPASSKLETICDNLDGAVCNGLTLIQRTLPDPSVVLVAPADGTVTSWNVFGDGDLRLRVFRPIGTSVIADGTSAVATDLKGGSNSTSLPIRAGEFVGVDLPLGGDGVGFLQAGQSATVSAFEPSVLEDGLADAPNGTDTNEELLLNATVVLAPSIAGLLPTSGSTTGGETVKIVGSNLDGATGVSFGSKPATFTVNSPNQITATAPAVPASTVDVRVIGPGGTSAINDGDKYTFTAATGTPGSTGPSLISPLTVAAKPTLTALAQTASKWRRGHQQAKISRAPVGTTFSFNLSKAAMVKLAFAQKASGRKVRGSCKAPNPSNAAKRKCTRTILAGSLSLPGHAGLNKLRFQGLLPNGKSLKLGSYNVSLTARDSGGLQSAPQSLSFSIVG